MNTGELADPNGYHRTVTHKIKRKVYWNEPGLRVTRLRLISDPGFPAWDVSYCHGRIGNEPVEVELPFSQLPKGKVAREIVRNAISDGVHAKKLGVLDNISCLN